MFQIAINANILFHLGMSESEIDDLNTGGLPHVIVIHRATFDHAHASRLEAVADPDRKRRSILLVGVADRHGIAGQLASWAKEIAVSDDGWSPRPLTETERGRLHGVLCHLRVPCVAPLLAALERTSLNELTAERRERIRRREYLVVTRHAALVTLLRERGHIGELATVISNASEADVAGRHVIGVLPMRLAALCATYSELPLLLEEQDRGISDLPIERLRQIAQPLTQYRVSQVPGPGY